MDRIRLEVVARVNPTEDREKVGKAILNIFPNARLAEEGLGNGLTILKGSSEGFEALERLKSLIGAERIRSAAKAILSSSKIGNALEFHLHKQAAFAGRVSFSQPFGESPLGPISVRVECEDPDGLIEWLTEPAARGSEERSGLG
ncbi:MAG: RNA-binding domain-containing protein [Candidatus Bathyarchaeia archaeon]